MSLSLTTRPQFTFVSTQRQLAELLTLNVASPPLPPTSSTSSTTARTIVNVVGKTSVDYLESLAHSDSRWVKVKDDDDDDDDHRRECKDKRSKSLLLTKIVVGTDDPNNITLGGAGNPLSPDPLRSNERQNQQFRQNLQDLRIPYTEQQVIQIFNAAQTTGVPGIFRVFVSALECADIQLIAFYSGEETLVYPLVPLTGPGVPLGLYLNQGISTFIEVPPTQLADAIKTLSSLPLVATTGAPFDEDLLCINANNVTSFLPRKATKGPKPLKVTKLSDAFKAVKGCKNRQRHSSK
jgi:hypothetical protein